MTIIDRRKSNSGKSTENRKRFIDRYKRQLRRSVDQVAGRRKIKDIFNDGNVTINSDSVEQPTFEHDSSTGDKEYILPGNKEYIKGDTIKKPKSGDGSGTQGGDGSDIEDEFTFTLTKEEFLDLYFHDMCLPRFVKESLKKDLKFKRQKAGYSKEGVPARLCIKKTMEQAIARRIATRSQGKKPRYLDDSDIRYDYFTKRPIPVRHAVMFCLMDVSASMTENLKHRAKKFFLLLYLFLHKEYQHVELRFIRHTTIADEVDEQTFFYGKRSGGTIVSSGLELINKLIGEYDSTKVNFYVAQASDGDNVIHDNDICVKLLEDQLLQKVQHFAYIEFVRECYADLQYQLGNWYTKIENPKMNVGFVGQDKDIFPVLRELFTE